MTVAAAVKPTDWNEYRISAEGTQIQSWINGVPAIDFTEAVTNIPLDGFIALQVHSGAKVLVQAKDLVIEELPPTPNAPTWEKTGMPAAENPAVAKP